MEKYTTHNDDEDQEDELDGFDFQPATDDEFSDLLSYDPKEMSEDTSDEDALEEYDQGMDDLFESLESIQPHIEDDETGEIWRELVNRARAHMDPDEGTSPASLRYTLNSLQECFTHLVNDVNYHKQNRD